MSTPTSNKLTPSQRRQDLEAQRAANKVFHAHRRAELNRERGFPPPSDGLIVRGQLVDARISRRRRSGIDFPGAGRGDRAPVIEIVVRDIPDEQAMERARAGEAVVSFDGYERMLRDDTLRLEIIRPENLEREAAIKAGIAKLEAELATLGTPLQGGE